MSIFWYIGAFALSLGPLIVFHELGHYWLAKALGVKVLRFSVGFGKPLFSRKFGPDQTEWALAAFPLGGYVKMLDEREGPVSVSELPRAFNRQTVWRRALIVVAGPLANLILAVLLYWGLFIHGVNEPKPVLAQPPAATAAAHAGVQDGELVRAVSGDAVTTLEEFRWQMMRRIADQQPVTLEVINRQGEIAFRNLDTHAVAVSDLDGNFTRILGLVPFRPVLKPIIGTVMPGSVAESSGLQSGDRVVSVNAKPVASFQELAMAIRASANTSLMLTLERNGQSLEVSVIPKGEVEAGETIGRIGIAGVDDPDARAALMVKVELSPFAALQKATQQTWDMSIFTVRMIGRMLIGELSWRNISGPVTIAEYAGQSAKLGLDYFLKFLALISISLGVLNLLPIPILDGGHLLYYLVEVIKGGPLSERAMEFGQRIGLVLLALLMAFAFFNDISRHISG